MLFKITFDGFSDSNIKFIFSFVWQKDIRQWFVIAVEKLCDGNDLAEGI